ncbi:MAG: hypothetical protein INQ03_16985 [Candidatus Heimdallarchaeota archaeon]|nr:hypothetical protein [Candidatus Heimdallarchaeota archaeon]
MNSTVWQSWFIFSLNPDTKTPARDFRKISWILLFCVALLGAFRDYFIYALMHDNFQESGISYDFREARYHAVIEFFMILVFYLILLRLYNYVQQTDPAQISLDLFYVIQYGFIKDVCFLIFLGVYSLSNDVFPRKYSYFEGNELLTIYWNLFSIYVVFTVLYFGKYIVARLKLSYQDFNKLLVAAFVISTLVFGVTYLIVFLLRFLIALPFGFEFWG